MPNYLRKSTNFKIEAKKFSILCTFKYVKSTFLVSFMAGFGLETKEKRLHLESYMKLMQKREKVFRCPVPLNFWMLVIFIEC